MRENAYNLQQAVCYRCSHLMPDISQTSIIASSAGPVMMCDQPCAAEAMGKGASLEPGSYPTTNIRIVAAPATASPRTGSTSTSN